MRRDGEHWTCACEACHEIRTLLGVDKILAVRPLVRDIELVEGQMAETPDGPKKDSLKEQYRKLHDQLAQVMQE